MTEIERLRDALDHIRRTADRGVKPTRRLAFISERATLALEGRDWDMRSLPPPEDSRLKLQKENAELRRRLAETTGGV